MLAQVIETDGARETTRNRLYSEVVMGNSGGGEGAQAVDVLALQCGTPLKGHHTMMDKSQHQPFSLAHQSVASTSPTPTSHSRRGGFT